jgi:hypothetical protein
LLPRLAVERARLDHLCDPWRRVVGWLAFWLDDLSLDKLGVGFYRDQLTWLDPPPRILGDSVLPTGVDRCGNIVGQVLQGFDVVGGILFSKRFQPVQCDGSQVMHQ